MTTKKISQITNEETTAFSLTDLFEGEESGGPSFKVSGAILLATVLSLGGGIGRYKLVPSVASNDLTLALKGLDGNDFSASAALSILLYDEQVTITSALSVTKAAGTNWCNLGATLLTGKEQDVFAYLVKETGASAGVKLAFSRYPGGHRVGDFSSTGTNEKYLAGPTNYNASDKVQLIGRFNVIMTGTNWSLPGTSVIVNYPIHQTRWLALNFPLNNVTVGSGSWSHTYRLNYRTMDVQFQLVHNSTSVTGTVTSSLPFTTIVNGATGAPMGLCNLLDSGIGTYYGSVDANGAGGVSIRLRCIDASASFAKLTAVHATQPFTWANNDEMTYNLSTLPI